MIKAIFWIAIFFFFISVLFYGIRYIFISLSKIFEDDQTQDHPTKRPPNDSTSPQSLTSHRLSFYDPTLDRKVEAYGEIIKCYREYDKLWVKFQLEENNTIKTIPIEHISGVENLKTQESKYNPTQISEYFSRFI